ncbi:RNA polymerase epsilon subunit [Bacillus sp. FJAT-50079]|uniref:DNA-dependent RNA polymerase subunit epsilon n=1 Tax=Bacillus sp. FJAT-50079 TaxID=2833577 RepID=UPI001BCA2015|nr:RNA polymerase epsilon subunit [Bacillus sp. FJAT-50079]MBS4207779.1 DUF1447 family protein [Bacillus sp. FJAT-50079]
MIYKVYYQEKENEVPVREETKTLFVKADSVRAVRQFLKDRPMNIEYVQLLEGAYLEYEKNSEGFELQEIQ